jgi:hypothetical protein
VYSVINPFIATKLLDPHELARFSMTSRGLRSAIVESVNTLGVSALPRIVFEVCRPGTAGGVLLRKITAEAPLIESALLHAFLAMPEEIRNPIWSYACRICPTAVDTIGLIFYI